tara:strand:- start:693 stop:1310 length:618 start_codon:yes stop_codon:yes gene_type:complete
MAQDIKITPATDDPQILFRGSGAVDTAVELNVLSSYQSGTGSGTAILFEGQEGQLFSITDNLSSGTLFSVADITGLPTLEVDASGDVKLAEYGNSVSVYTGFKTPLEDNTDGSTITFDLNAANTHTVTLGGNRTLALSNVDAGQKFIIRLVQDGTGSRTVTWFSTIKWPGGTTPTLTTTANKTDVFGFICTSAGNYDGFVVGLNL